ncbi:hypothetical protein OKHIF_14720 [Mycobacteroides chelonae]
MPDRDMSEHGGKRLLVEHLTDQTEILEHNHLRAIGDSDTRGLLAAVLQRVQPVVREFCYFFAGCPDPEYAAFFTRVVFQLNRLCGHYGCSLVGGG